MKQKYFHIVNFKDITNWSVIQQNVHDFGYSEKYPLVPIGKFLVRNKTIINIEDNVLYKRLSIHSKNGGIDVRDEIYGRSIGTKKQFLVKSGQFALSKIDARNGAFGVVPEIADGAIITGNFWTFDVDYSRVNPVFLTLLTTTESFVRFAEMASNGTTNRHYLQEVKFLEQRIPLPTLEEQNRLIEIYNGKISDAEKKYSKYSTTTLEINNYLNAKLGLSVSKMGKSNGLKSIHFKDITRWDYQFYKTKKQISSIYPLVEIGTLLHPFMVGTHSSSIRCNTSEMPNELFTYIGMENIEKESGVLLDPDEKRGFEIKSQTLRVPKGYMIYGKLRPYLNKYWMNNSDKTNIICSSEFFVFDVKNINKNYFLYMLASLFTQEQISDSYSGARMPRINEDVFKSIQMPIPPQTIQQEIVDYITYERERALDLKEQVNLIREQAKNEFEKQIFTPC